MTIASLFMLAVLPFAHGTLTSVMATAGAMASVPIIIHLLNRRRFRRVIWAAMEWLLAAQRKNARRIRIEQLLLLLIRTMIMILIVMALAQPVLRAIGLTLPGESRALRIIVLDDSYSMSFGADKASASDINNLVNTPFAQAKAAAIDLIKTFDRGDRVMVILGGSRSESMTRRLTKEPGTLHEAIIKQIESLDPSYRATDLGGAMVEARAVLEAEAKKLGVPKYDQDVQVIIITDRTKSAWQPLATGEVGAPIPLQVADGLKLLREIMSKADKLHLAVIDASDMGGQQNGQPAQGNGGGAAKNPANVAITALSARHDPDPNVNAVFISATVHNFGTAKVDGLLRLTRDPVGGVKGQTPVDFQISVPAGQSVTVETSPTEEKKQMTFPEPGFHTVRAVLLAADGKGDIGDNMLLDNERFLSVRVRRWISVRLIDGREAAPGEEPAKSSVFYLRYVLAPITKTASDAAEEELSAYTLHPDPDASIKPGSTWLDHHDVAVLSNVNLTGAGGEAVARDITQFVARGGCLLIFPGDQVQGPDQLARYNDLLYRDGNGPMPAQLRELVGTKRNDGDAESDKSESMVIKDDRHPVMAVLLKDKPTLFKTARFDFHIKAKESDKNGIQVPLRYSGGDPALVLGRFGDGQVALFTSPMNADWNNLVGNGDFVALMQELTNYLAPKVDLARNLRAGERVKELLTSAQGERASLALPLAGWTTPRGRAVPKATAGPRPVDAASKAPVGLWQSQATTEDLEAPGIYELTVSGATSATTDYKPVPTDRLERLTQFYYAVNPPALAEGDLTPQGDVAIKAILGEGATVLNGRDWKKAWMDLSSDRDISRYLLYAVLALCLLESLLAQRFGHFHEAGAAEGMASRRAVAA